MELRRAILLFAIVLGLAAVVTALSSGGRHNEDRSDPTPASAEPAVPQPSTPSAGTDPSSEPGVASVRIDASRAPTSKSITAQRATTITVSTDDPGTVTVPALGLTENAEPGSPAILDVLPDEPTATPIKVEFTSAGDEATRTIGRLEVRPSSASR